MKLEFPRQIIEKYSDIKFNENASNGSRVVPCGRTETNWTVPFSISRRRLKSGLLIKEQTRQNINLGTRNLDYKSTFRKDP